MDNPAATRRELGEGGEVIWDQPGFSDAEKRAILGGNALALFDLPKLTTTRR